MTAGRRWAVVALLTTLLVAVPVVLRSLPPAQSDVGAGRLLAQLRASQDRGWSGFVETQGTLSLPSVRYFDDVASLLGGSTQLRAWWRAPDRWRVDRLSPTGEDDLVHDGTQTLDYSYEDAEARVYVDPSVRLPRTADLLPPALAKRALDGVGADDVTRIDSRRVAGISAPGLRITPASPLSSVDHVEVWVDPGSGVALRVEVHADPHGAPSFTSAFRDFSATTPPVSRVSFEPTPTTAVRFDAILDIADAANQYAPFRPPAVVAGLPASSASDGAVGVYGRGLTELVAIPLRDREADALRTQLLAIPRAQQTADGTSASQGVLGVLVTGAQGDDGWLVAGTVTPSTLVWAARDVTAHHDYVGPSR